MVRPLRLQRISLWQISLHPLLRDGQMRRFLCGGPSSNVLGDEHEADHADMQ
jgi:hypothetical protein